MAGRGSAFTRAVDYFKTAQIDEARAALQVAAEAVNTRLSQVEGPKAVNQTRKPRKPRTNAHAPALNLGSNESLADA